MKIVLKEGGSSIGDLQLTLAVRKDDVDILKDVVESYGDDVKKFTDMDIKEISLVNFDHNHPT